MGGAAAGRQEPVEVSPARPKLAPHAPTLNESDRNPAKAWDPGVGAMDIAKVVAVHTASMCDPARPRPQ